MVADRFTPVVLACVVKVNDVAVACSVSQVAVVVGVHVQLGSVVTATTPVLIPESTLLIDGLSV